MQHTLTTKRGLSFIELTIVIGILLLLLGITMYTFVTYRKSQNFTLDTQKLVSIINQARTQTLFSKDATVYGVHLASNSATLFTGTTYSAGVSTNEDVQFATADLSITYSLNGGGSDVVFNMLTGETDQNGTITLSSPSTSQTKTVTIYKTGLVDF